MGRIIRVDGKAYGNVNRNVTRVMFSLLLLLFAMGSTAQIVDPIEQSYGPYTRPSTGYEPALAVSRTGVLLAWSEVDASSDLPQIRVGLLDFSGRLVSPITTIASTGRADLPSVASDGNGFRVAFVELRKSEGSRRYAMTVDFDRAGRLAGEPQQLLAYEHYESAYHPRLYWNGLSFVVAHRTDDEAVAVLNDDLAFAAWSRERVLVGGFPGGSFIERLELWWWSIHVKGSYRLRVGERAGPIAIAGRGNRTALAWSSDPGVSYLELTNGALTTPPILIPASIVLAERPALACDATHCLLAWTTKAQQVYGVLLARDPFPSPAPVPIELASSVEKPQIHVLRNGRFLVTYVSWQTMSGSRMAGRIVTTAASPRRRAVR